MPLTKPKGIVIHHSLTPDGKVCDWDAIKRYHIEEKGWNDIGYHFGVESIGGTVNILTGRPINMTGAHTIGHNDMIGICVVGNYDSAAPDDAHMTALVQLVAALLCQFPYLTLEDLHEHSEYAPKTCPGKSFPWVNFLAAVQERRV